MIALLPCPFCRCGIVHVNETGDEFNNPVYFLSCPECHADGPPSATEEQAIAAWNRRPYREDIKKAIAAAEADAAAKKLFKG